VEVLSDSTELYDRTKKWEQYRRIKSLRYYLLVSQNEYQVDMYHRANETSLFYFQSFNSLDEMILFENLGFCLKLSEIYAGIKLEVLEA
jgi:Uma2 family endonuclease